MIIKNTLFYAGTSFLPHKNRGRAAIHCLHSPANIILLYVC